jgi:hypothetical protein
VSRPNTRRPGKEEEVHSGMAAYRRPALEAACFRMAFLNLSSSRSIEMPEPPRMPAPPRRHITPKPHPNLPPPPSPPPPPPFSTLEGLLCTPAAIACSRQSNSLPASLCGTWDQPFKPAAAAVFPRPLLPSNPLPTPQVESAEPATWIQDAAAAAAKKNAISRGWNAQNSAFRAILEAPSTEHLQSPLSGRESMTGFTVAHTPELHVLLWARS